MRSGSKTSLVLCVLYLFFAGKFTDSYGGVSNLIQPSFRGARSLNVFANDAIPDSPMTTAANTTNATNTTASDAGTGGALTSIGTITDNMLVSSPRMPIPFTLRTFDAAEIGKYSTCADFRNDLQNSAAFSVSLTILQNSEYFGYDSMFENETAVPPGTRAMSASQQKAGIKTASSGRTNSYNTHNQVDGIDEADFVKTDGVNVFAGYNNAVVVWDAVLGVELSRTVIPNPTTPGAATPGAGDAPTEPTLQVRSLFLNGNRLVVIVDNTYLFMSGDLNLPIIPFNGSTRVLFFDITNIPRDGSELRLLTEEVLPGNYFQTAYFIGNYLHCVGGSIWDTYTHLDQFFDRWSEEYAGLNSAEYIAAAVAASEKVIKNFVTKLTSELGIGNSCEDIPQLAIFLDGGSNNGRSVSVDVATNAGVLGGFVYITTLNTQFDPITQNKIQLATAAIAISNWGVVPYANDGYLFLVSQGSSTNENDRYEAVSYVLACTLSATGRSATIQSVGIVPGGSIYDPFMIDYNQRHLRIATTISADWGCANREYLSSDSYYNFTECDYQLLSKAKTIITVLNIPLDRNNRLQQVGLLEILGSVDDAYISSVRFVQNKAFVVISETSGSSSLYILDMRDPTALDVFGTVDFSESYSQLQLFDTDGDFLIAVGQDRNYTKPQLGLFDTTDSRNPVLIQQYDDVPGKANMSNVSGFGDAVYDYKALRWLPDVNKLILPYRRVNVYEETEYYSTDDGSTSSVTTIGDNIIFEGFVVFDVTTEKFELDFEVNQATAQNSQVVCWNSVVLPSRSLVIDGVLTTIKGSTVVATRLDSKEEVFVLNLDKDAIKTACPPYVGYYAGF